MRARRSVLYLQTEKGIRGLVRSRGLGDVYKGQDVDNDISELNNEKGPADFVRVDVPRPCCRTCPRTMIYPFEGTQLSVEGASEGLGELSKNGFAASTGDTLVNVSRVPLVGVTNEDHVLLKPREWWNDTLIDFCIEW